MSQEATQRLKSNLKTLGLSSSRMVGGLLPRIDIWLNMGQTNSSNLCKAYYLVSYISSTIYSVYY